MDITIKQPINRHAKSHGGMIGFGRNYSAYFHLCRTRQFRAKYVEATLQVTDMVLEDVSLYKELQQSQVHVSGNNVKNVVVVVRNFLYPFH